jgi:hypothetical protein
MIYIGLFILFIILIFINIIEYARNRELAHDFWRTCCRLMELAKDSKKYREQYSPNQIQQVNVRPQPIPLTSQ